MLLIVLITAVAVWQYRVRHRYGEAMALCPGPDFYGYRCDESADIAYIDATIDTELYVDDGTVAIPLPFPFTFYGTTYGEVVASSNGNLQFVTSSDAYRNVCLDSNVQAFAMGDMIAPYWDDLTLVRSGFLEVELVGVAPERVLVVEWDQVPRFGRADDTVTFEIQLFEANNDIAFLYKDVATAASPNGSSATIGIQSARQGLSLMRSCDEAAVGNGRILRLEHPEVRNPALAANIAPIIHTAAAAEPTFLKGDVLMLVEALNARGEEALPRLKLSWLQQSPPRQTEWAWADVTGDGRDELVVLWKGQPTHTELTQLVVLGRTEDQRFEALGAAPLVLRGDDSAVRELYSLVDKTGDQITDIVVSDGANGRMIYSWHGGSLTRMR